MGSYFCISYILEIHNLTQLCDYKNHFLYKIAMYFDQIASSSVLQKYLTRGWLCIVTVTVIRPWTVMSSLRSRHNLFC